MSEGIEILISADDQASAKLKAVSDNVDKAAKQQVAAFREIGGRAKGATEFVGILASLTGNSELAGYAGQLAQVTEKTGQFAEVAKAGGAGAMAFKAGLAALSAVGGFTVGNAIGRWLIGAKDAERQLASLTERTAALRGELLRASVVQFSQRKEDFELIADPAAKQAAQRQYLATLNAEITAVTANVAKSKKTVEEWADAWQITGERKEAAKMAQTELENDKQRLAFLKQFRDEMIQLSSDRVRNNEAIREENLQREKSKGYLETLRQEVEYLKATREEQIKLDAARNTVGRDQGEAENLLKERDAILAKAEAEKVAKQAAIEAGKEIERQRERQAIYIEQRDQRRREIFEREEERKRLAWNEEVEREEQQRDRLKQDPGTLQATQGRLLTRGSGMDRSPADEERRKQLAEIDKNMKEANTINRQMLRALQSGDRLQVEFIS